MLSGIGVFRRDSFYFIQQDQVNPADIRVKVTIRKDKVMYIENAWNLNNNSFWNFKFN